MKKAKILIVEDEVIIAMETESSLRGLGYEITSIVDTGKKAIEKAEIDKPDLILMDIRIKGKMDGIEAAEVIRSRFNIPIVFSTAYLDEERIERAKIAMPFGYVLKPIQERDLKVTIEMALHVGKVDNERKKTEDDLRLSERRFHLAMEATSDGLFDWNIATNEIYYSPGYFTMLGYEPDELPHTLETVQSLLQPEDAIRSEENLKNFLASKIDNNSIELRLKAKSGDWVWVLSRGKIVEHDENGAPYRMVGTNVNIDEQKRIQKILRFEKARTQQYLDVAGVLLVALDVNGYVTSINPKGCEILGYEKEEVVGRNWFDNFLLSEGIDKVKQVFNQIVKGNITPSEYYENPIVRKDGSQRFIAWHNSVLRDHSGKIDGLFSSGNDITSTVKSQQALKDSEALLKKIAENYPNSYLSIIEKDMSISYMAGQEFTKQKRDPEHFVGLTIDQVYGDQATFVQDHVKRTFSGEECSFEFLFNGQNQLYRTVPLYSDDGVIHRILTVAENVTERKHVEEKLKNSEAQKYTILDGVSAHIAFVNDKLEILWANKTAADSVNKRPNEMLGLKCFKLWADQEEPCEDCPIIKAFYSKKSEHTIMHTLDGRIWDNKGEPVFDSEGNVIGVVEIAQDITQRKLDEQELTRSEDIVNNIQVGLHIYHLEDLTDDRTLKMILANKASENITGATAEEVVGKTLDESFPGLREKGIPQKYAEVVRTQQATKIENLYHRNEKVDQAWYSIQAFPLPDNHLGVTFEDITEQKQTKELLRKNMEDLDEALRITKVGNPAH